VKINREITVNEQPRIKEGFVEAEPVEVPASSPPPASVEIAESWPIKVKLLHKPVRDNKGAPLQELTFREPTGGDINRYGNPVRIDQNGDVIIDEKKMSLIMSSLAGVLLPFLEQMDPRDWNSCAYRLRSFFLPDPAAW
jgi:tail assembly chaperone E/41/14-like protein